MTLSQLPCGDPPLLTSDESSAARLVQYPRGLLGEISICAGRALIAKTNTAGADPGGGNV